MWIQIVRHSSLVSVDYSAILFPTCSCVQLKDHFVNIATKKWSRPLDPLSLLKGRTTISPRPFKMGEIPGEKSSSKIVHSLISIIFFHPTIFFFFKNQKFISNLKTQLWFLFTGDLSIKNILTNFLFSNIFHDLPVEFCNRRIKTERVSWIENSFIPFYKRINSTRLITLYTWKY